MSLLRDFECVEINGARHKASNVIKCRTSWGFHSLECPQFTGSDVINQQIKMRFAAVYATLSSGKVRGFWPGLMKSNVVTHLKEDDMRAPQK